MSESTHFVRHYRCKDVEVLTASSEIVTFAQSMLSDIITTRPTWADPFFPNLKTQIDNAFSTYLGVDNAADLRNKTAILHSIMTPAKADIATFKVDVEQDFRNNKPQLNEIETTLGYKAHWSAIRNNDQEAMIELLYKFKNNMNPTLQGQIVGAGMDPALIPRILSYADTLRDANINQEFAKSQRPLISGAAVSAFNDIYDTVISVCVILHHKYYSNPIIRDNFSFSAVVKRLNSHPGEPTPGP